MAYVTYDRRVKRLNERGARMIGASRKFYASGGFYMPSELWAFPSGAVYHLITFRSGSTELVRSSRTATQIERLR